MNIYQLNAPALATLIKVWESLNRLKQVMHKPKRIKVQLLPYDNCDIEKLAINLDNSGFISIYSVLDQLYVKVLNFDKHQNPHKNENGKGSDIPDITEADFFHQKKSNKDTVMLKTIKQILCRHTWEWEEKIKVCRKCEAMKNV